MQERILETADRLFYGQGIRAVGVDEIADEIGISKRTLYNHYPSQPLPVEGGADRRLPVAPLGRAKDQGAAAFGTNPRRVRQDRRLDGERKLSRLPLI
jgi:hypothetical protein